MYFMYYFIDLFLYQPWKEQESEKLISIVIQKKFHN